jgi:Xaa-Pro dipeptidase
MTVGVGGSTAEAELARMQSMTAGVAPISDHERQSRIERAQRLMQAQTIQALYLDTSTAMRYLTGMTLRGSERLHGAVIPAKGGIVYLCPAFEEAKTRTMIRFGDDVRCWEEHEDPTALVIDTVRSFGTPSGTIAIDPATPFFTFDGLRRAGNSFDFINGSQVTAACRMIKSPAEIALIERAMAITLEVQKAAARILAEGITTTEVSAFITAAHLKLGAEAPVSAGLVLFGEPTAYPHGVPYAQTLKRGDMVLMDVGAGLDGYRSDITRSYVFGDPTPRQRQVWELDQASQAAAFEAAKLGASCESVDAAARRVIEGGGFGPGYALPGLPHRTGHGLGLDVHEEPYIVQGNATKLAPGMCFSDEPTICIYGEFGVRLEDHIHMEADGPHWFTRPCHSVDDPFGYEG